MARLCSPGRDEKIRELTTLRDVIPLYKGIFQVNSNSFPINRLNSSDESISYFFSVDAGADETGYGEFHK